MKIVVASCLLFLAFIAAGISCNNAKDGVSKKSTENTNFSVTFLFSVDSCKVYRFSDAGRYRYIVTCPGGMTMGGYTTTHSSGKSTYTKYHPEDIQTVEYPRSLKKIKEGIYIDTALLKIN